MKVRLWCAKTRLVPSKKENIPRLELLGCLLLSKLIKSVCEAIGGIVRLSEIYCWSDTQISLWWIDKQTHKNWKVWVQNRVVVIRDNVPSQRWFYVPTKINPADIATGITNSIKLASNSLWWNGPNFLITEQLEIPNQDNFATIKDIEKSNDAVKVTVAEEKISGGIGEVIDCSKFGSIEKLL